MVFFNDTIFDINLLVTRKYKHINHIQDKININVRPGKIFNVPLTWFLNESTISKLIKNLFFIEHQQTEGVHRMTPIFENLTKIFDAQIGKPYTDYS